MSPSRAPTLSRKDWHSGAIGAVLSVNFQRQGRPEILPRPLHRRGGASVVRRDAAKPNGGSQMSKSAKKRPMALAPAAVPTPKSSRHSAGDSEPKRADCGSKQ